MLKDQQIQVQVCYASTREVHLIPVVLSARATIREAIEQSGVMKICPEIHIDGIKLGVYGKLKELTSQLHAGDRIEIYRKLVADPMEARRRRAKKQAKQ